MNRHHAFRSTNPRKSKGAARSPAISSADYQPGHFLDPLAYLQGLGEGLRGNDSGAALSDLRFNDITALRGDT